MYNLFNELEGKKGEVMTVSALRYLLMRNRPYREHFFKALSEHVHYSRRKNREYFGCLIEEPCTYIQKNDPDARDLPSIDMIVESNYAIVGVEANPRLEITSAQMVSYISELAQRRKVYNQLKGMDTEVYFVILIPKLMESKAVVTKEMAEEEIRKRNLSDLQIEPEHIPKMISVVVWEDLIEGIQKANKESEIKNEDSYILGMLTEYINEWTSEDAMAVSNI